MSPLLSVYPLFAKQAQGVSGSGDGFLTGTINAMKWRSFGVAFRQDTDLTGIDGIIGAIIL